MTLSVGEQRRRWIDATKQVAAGNWDDIRCPAKDDDFLEIQVSEWRSGPDAPTMYEYRLRCPRCGAENFMHGPQEYTAKR
jgi:hypothetical protein